MLALPETRGQGVGRSAHWERGYRCHGYWLDGASIRVGCVGLSPFIPGRKTEYYATIDGVPGLQEVAVKDLRAGKRFVESKCRELFGIINGKV